MNLKFDAVDVLVHLVHVIVSEGLRFFDGCW